MTRSTDGLTSLDAWVGGIDERLQSLTETIQQKDEIMREFERAMETPGTADELRERAKRMTWRLLNIIYP